MSHNLCMWATPAYTHKAWGININTAVLRARYTSAYMIPKTSTELLKWHASYKKAEMYIAERAERCTFNVFIKSTFSTLHSPHMHICSKKAHCCCSSNYSDTQPGKIFPRNE